jgi:stage III sporulation protein SpoIIIAA
MTKIKNIDYNMSKNKKTITKLSMLEKIPPHRRQITDDLNKLLAILPSHIQETIEKHPKKDQLIEVILDLGRLPEARFPDEVAYLSEIPVSKADIEQCVAKVGTFSGDNRGGIERTLHRISAIRNRSGEIIGLTCRIGRAVFGTITMIRDLVETGQSILLLGRPGVGKTTALREIARVLADDLKKRVVIIDTSNEIAGDGDIPHPAIGRARRMQVARPELQHQVMIEAVENHTPEVIVIDEIGTELEAQAARTIAERGVQLVGTAHGNQLENLIKNPTLADLIGGIQAVTLGDEEARRRGSQKTVLERKAPPTFGIAVEMLERQKWVVHENVSQTVDLLLRHHQPALQVRTISDDGEVKITQEKPLSVVQGFQDETPTISTPLYSSGWSTSGKMSPVAPFSTKSAKSGKHQDFEQLLAQSWHNQDLLQEDVIWHDDNELPLKIYPYGVSRPQLQEVIEILSFPVVLTNEMKSADALIALRSQIKKDAKLRQIAKVNQIPVYGIKSNSIPQMTRALKRLLKIDDPQIPDQQELNLFTHNRNDDEIEALEEARLAVEQVVIPTGQPVELLPRSAKVRKMQHELIEHYRLQCDSFGEEPNCRLRIYPA